MRVLSSAPERSAKRPLLTGRPPRCSSTNRPAAGCPTTPTATPPRPDSAND